MAVGPVGHVLHAGHVEVAVEVLLQLRGNVAKVHVAVEVHIGDVGGDGSQRAAVVLHDAAVQRVERKRLVVAHNYNLGAAERAVQRVQAGPAQVGHQVTLHAQIAAGIEAQRREVGPAQIQFGYFVSRVARVAQVHYGAQVEVQVGVVFAAGVDDVAVAVEVDGGGHAVVGVAVVAGALHVGAHLAHQRTGVLQVAGGVDAARGRDAPNRRVLQQLAEVKPAHRERTYYWLPPIGLPGPQLPAEREVAVSRTQLQIGVKRQRGRPAPERAAHRQRGRNADVVWDATLRREAENIGPRGAELLNVEVGVQPRIGVRQALNPTPPGLEHRIAQAHKLQVAHREVAHAAGNLPVQQYALVGAGIEGRGTGQARGQVQNIAEAQPHIAQVALNLQLRQLLHVAQRGQILVANGQRAPDAGMRRNQIESVEPNLHRVVHHVGLPRIDFEAALFPPGQIVDFAGGAILRVAQIVRVQYEVAEIEVVIVERRQAGALLRLVEVVELHGQAADVGLVEQHAPARGGGGLAGGGFGLVGGFIELAHGLGGVHHALLHGYGLVLGVGESGVFERELAQRHALLLQVNILGRDIGQANFCADKLRRGGVLVHKGHAVERRVVQAQLQGKRLGGAGGFYFGSRFGLHDADGRAPQRRVIHLIDRLIHIYLVHIGRELADTRPNIGARHLVVLREVDISEAGLADVVFQRRGRGVDRCVGVDEGVDDEVVVVHRIGLGAREAHAAVVQLHAGNVYLAVQQGPDVEVDPEVADRQQRVAPLVFQVYAVEVDGVAEVGAEFPDSHLRFELAAQVAFGFAGHKILPGRELKHYDYRDNQQQDKGQ